jgi:hypothetical protein
MFDCCTRKLRNESTFVDRRKIEVEAASFNPHVAKVGSCREAKRPGRDGKFDPPLQFQHQTIAVGIEVYGDCTRLDGSRFITAPHRAGNHFVNRLHAAISKHGKA